MKTMRKWLIVALSMIVMMTCAMGMTVVFANDNQTATSLQAINYSISKTQVRIGFEDDGQGGQQVTGYDQNGIKFVATMSKADYDALSMDVVFGALVLPQDYIETKGAITEENVFGANSIYTFDNNDTSKTYIAHIEVNDLVLSNNGTADDDSDDYYYYNVSMVNLNANNKDREMIAVPYLKALEGENLVYCIKEGTQVYSMAYLAQLKLEESVAPDIAAALQENYIDGLTQKISVDYNRAYGSINNEATGELLFDLGANLTIDTVKEAIKTQLKVDVDNCTVTDSQLLVNGAEVDSAKVYANGKTNAEISIDLSVDEVDAYQSGYYTSETYDSVILGDDKFITVNADFAQDGEVTTGTYALYRDGAMIVNIGGENLFGTYTPSISIELGGQNHVYTVADSYELPKEVYAKVAGAYLDSESTLVVLNADGTLTSGLEKGGNYLLAYNASANKMQINLTTLAGASVTKDLSYNGSKIAIEDYTASEKIVASAETYAQFANKYSAQLKYAGDYSSGDTPPLSTNTFESYFDFNADGSLAYKGAEQIAKGRYHWTTPGTALLQDVKYGNYVLYTDGTMQIYIPQYVDVGVNSSSSGIADKLVDVIVEGTYDLTANTITVDFSAYKGWENNPTFTGTTKFEPTEEFMTALYTNFANDKSSAPTSTVYLDTSKVFKPDYTNLQIQCFQADSNGNRKISIHDGAGIYDFYYDLVPITETFGEVVVKYSTGGRAANFNAIYYTQVTDALFKLRISYNVIDHLNNGYTAYSTAYGHFVDAKASWDGDNTASLAVEAFKLLGGQGTAETPSSISYAGQGVTLALFADGVNKMSYNPADTSKFSGNKAIFNGGTGDIVANYDIVPSSANTGLIFIHLAENPQMKADIDMTKVIQGEYYVKNGKTCIDFTYNGANYSLTTGVSQTKQQVLAGTYLGNGDALVLNADGSATLGGAAASYVLNGDNITITCDSTVLSGTYKINGADIRLNLGKVVYIKQLLSLTELYAKYAGTYTGSYTVLGYQTSWYNATGNPYSSRDIDATMTLILTADGKIQATGTGKVAGKNEDVGDDAMRLNGGGVSGIHYGHLGAEANLGTYTFEIINGEIQIVLKFDVITEKNANEDTINNNSGYAQRLIANNGGGVSSLYPTSLKTANLYQVWNYANGTVSDGALDIVFQAFGDSAIHLERVAE